jgi:uncharacterized protein
MQTTPYGDVQDILSAARSVADAAEAHGTLAGSLCSTVGYRYEDWLQEILPEGRAGAAEAGVLQQLFSGTAQALEAAEMNFALLLPDDEQPLEQRAEALGQWCHGFLYGLGTSALADATQLPGEVGEVVRDITEITRVGVDASESNEANEAAYAELVEFVRVGVQLVFEELGSLRQPPPPRPEGTVH